MSQRPELNPAPRAVLEFPKLGFTLEGSSVAGIATWLTVRSWSLAIDCGALTQATVRCSTLALTHTHLDHAGGVASWLALRRLGGMGTSTVLAPVETAPEIQRIVDTWESMYRHPFDWRLVPMAPGDRHPLRNDLSVEALPADHVIPTRGWAVWRQRRRLKPSLHGASGPEIKRRKASGEDVHVRDEELLLAVSGDTRATMAHTVPALRDAKVACVETTFLDDKCSVERAQSGGHTHLDELLDVPWGCQTLVPYHVSQRYDVARARDILQARLAPTLPAGVSLKPLLP